MIESIPDIAFGAAFPSVLCVYLVIRFEETLKANTKAINDLRALIGERVKV